MVQRTVTRKLTNCIVISILILYIAAKSISSVNHYMLHDCIILHILLEKYIRGAQILEPRHSDDLIYYGGT
jgi:hypothetical protein